MSTPATPPMAPDWASVSGDIWARRWRDTDRGLAGLAPFLLDAVVDRAPSGAFTAFEIGCGPGSTTLAVAEACANASIIACDVSPALVQVARERTEAVSNIRVVLGDAEEVASSEGPFDLIFSRHGVMFFPDPVRAFERLRRAVDPGASVVFSCFRDWQLNPWASELANAAADKIVPTPGRESGGFAFADADYVAGILTSAGWQDPEPQPVDFRYVAADGDGAVDAALSYLLDIGPAARVFESLAEAERTRAAERMRGIIERHLEDSEVAFPAAAWIWRASAPRD